MRLSGIASWLLCLASVGCGDDGGSATADAPRADAGPSCQPGGHTYPLVVSLNGTTDAIKVFGLSGGQLVDNNLEFPATNPDDVVIRSDGAEALVSYGGFGQNYGVYVLELGPDASSARIKQTLVIGTDRVTYGIAYADDNHAVLATAAGSTGHTLTTLSRTGTGDWQAGMTAPVPNDWPLQLERRPGTSEVVLARSLLSTDPNTDFYRVAQNGTGTWATTGSPTMIPDQPLDMGLSPDGSILFAATSDPADPVTPTNLDGKGLVHAVPITSSGFGTATTVSLAGPGTNVAVDPNGRFLITDAPVFELDSGSGTPITYTRKLITVPLTSGTLGTPMTETSSWPALLLYGLAVAPSGHVVRSRQLYPIQAPEADRTPIDVLLPTGTGDFQTCVTMSLPGQGRFAIGP